MRPQQSLINPFHSSGLPRMSGGPKGSGGTQGSAGTRRRLPVRAGSGNSATPSGLNDNSETHNLQIVDLQELRIRKVDTDEIRQAKRRRVDQLNGMIQDMAVVHRAEYLGDAETLNNVIQHHPDILKGYLVYCNGLPIAYSIYYMALDQEGRVFVYAEDNYVHRSYSGFGVSKKLVYETAHRGSKLGANRMTFITDKRNIPLQNLAPKVFARIDDIDVIDATQAMIRTEESWSPNNTRHFTSYPLSARHIEAVQELGFSSDVITQTGGFDFRGFITFEEDNGLIRPVCISFGWLGYSTFKNKIGLYLEQPQFANDVEDESKKDILSSIFLAVQELSSGDDQDLSLKWKIKKDDELLKSLLLERGSSVDSMIGTKESEVIPYVIDGEDFQNVARNPQFASGAVLVVPEGAPIGGYVPKTPPSTGTQPA
jgi:hypothetical protein